MFYIVYAALNENKNKFQIQTQKSLSFHYYNDTT